MDTPHVFLDTEIFVANSFHFESPLFVKLAELAQKRVIFVYLTTVTVREIETHIASDIEEAVTHIRALQKKQKSVNVLGLTSNSPFPILPKNFDREATKQRVLDSFHGFLQAARAEIIEVEGISIDEILEKYFGSIPPFGSGEKKHEFPDAFALAGLQKWCDESGNRIFVVSNDGDMSSACDSSESFYSLRRVQELFDLIARDQQELYEFAGNLFREHRGEIEDLLREGFLDIGLFIDQPESDVFDVEVRGIDVVSELATEVTSENAQFEVQVEITFKADISYAELVIEDIPVLMNEEKIEQTLELKAKVSLLYDREDPDAFQVETVGFEDDSLLLDLEPSPEELK